MKDKKRVKYAVAHVGHEFGNAPSISWYFWSDWGMDQLFQGVEEDGEKISVGSVTRRARPIAKFVLQEMGVLIPHRSNASPYQPAIPALIDLVLFFGKAGSVSVCRTLWRLARRIEDHCSAKKVYAFLSNTQYSDVSDRRLAFAELVSGAAELVRQGRKEELSWFLLSENPWPILTASITRDPYGNPCEREVAEKFIAAIRNAQPLNLFGCYGYRVEVKGEESPPAETTRMRRF